MSESIQKIQGYARRNHELGDADRKKNGDAVGAMVSLLGGIVGMKAEGVGFAQLSHILEADPDNDLSGLRMIAERMDHGSMSYDLYPKGEAILDPATARRWLIGTGRVVIGESGDLVAVDSDHITLSGLAVAGGNEEGERLSDAYQRITDNPSPLSEDFLTDMSWHILDRYSDPNPGS